MFIKLENIKMYMQFQDMVVSAEDMGVNLVAISPSASSSSGSNHKDRELIISVVEQKVSDGLRGYKEVAFEI